MSRKIGPPAKSPCGSCPYRCDVPSGVWAKEEYDKLPEYDKPTLGQPMGVFACHQQDGKACAGWVGVHDMQNSFGLRMALHLGVVEPEDADAFYDYTTSVPLFASGQEASDHGMKDVENPGEKARRVVDKLTKTVPGVIPG